MYRLLIARFLINAGLFLLGAILMIAFLRRLMIVFLAWIMV